MGIAKVDTFSCRGHSWCILCEDGRLGHGKRRENGRKEEGKLMHDVSLVSSVVKFMAVRGGEN